MNFYLWRANSELWASLVAPMVKILPGMQKTWVRSLGWEDPLQKGTATHSSILAWRIPWTEEPVGYNPWGRRVGHDWVTHTHTHTQHMSDLVLRPGIEPVAPGLGVPSLSYCTIREVPQDIFAWPSIYQHKSFPVETYTLRIHQSPSFSADCGPHTAELWWRAWCPGASFACTGQMDPGHLFICPRL